NVFCIWVLIKRACRLLQCQLFKPFSLMEISRLAGYRRSRNYIGAQRIISAFRKLYRRSGDYIGVQKNISAFTDPPPLFPEKEALPASTISTHPHKGIFRKTENLLYN